MFITLGNDKGFALTDETEILQKRSKNISTQFMNEKK
jgi:hypothetical protein